MLFALLILQPLLATAAELKLGFLFTHSSESWLQESWSLFKLAIQDVNANATLLPSHTLTYAAFDAQADGKIAYSGAESLISAGVVGIVGTGHSEVLRPVAVGCSAAAVPVVSPTSTSGDLVNKAGYPFLFRTQLNDAGMLKAMAVIMKELQWYVCALVANIHLAPAVSEILGPALQAAKIVSSPEYYLEPSTQQNREFLLRLLTGVKGKGFRIIALHAKASDMSLMWAYANQLGLHGAGYCWVMTEDAYVAPWVGSAVDVLVARRINTDVLGLGDAFRARWPSVATRYDQAAHGPFDPATNLPFYNATDPTIWDTGSGTTGDGVPERVSLSAYDSVFVLAEALHAVVAAGGDPQNGTQVRGALLATQYAGITGKVEFSPVTQDREAPVEVVLTQGAAAPYLIGQATPALAAALTSDWCAAGCLNATSAQLLALPWSRGLGEIPKDGTELSLTKTIANWGNMRPKADGIDTFSVGMFLTDNFGKLPCRQVCALHGQTSAACGRCFAGYHKDFFELEAYPENMAGPRLRPLVPRHTVEVAHVSFLYIVEVAFEGRSAEDRVIVLRATYKGSLLADGMRVWPLTSTSCPAGEFGAENAGFPPCVKCLPGNYSSARGAVLCSFCPAGQSAAQSGQSGCQSCVAGRYTDRQGLPECKYCEQGKYQPATGALSCVPCPPPMTTMRVGLADVTSCVCPAGFYRPRGSHLTEGMTRGPCEPCPRGMKCERGADARYFPGSAGANNATDAIYPLLKPKFWSTPHHPLSVFECKEAASQCPGGAPGTCAEHAIDKLCARCEEGYYASQVTGGCIECPSTAASSLLFPTAVVLASILGIIPLYYLNKDSRTISWNSSKMVVGQIVTILVMYLQIAALTRTLNLDIPLPKVDLLIMAARPFGLLQLECTGTSKFGPTVAINLLTPAWCASLLGAVGLISYVLSKVLRRRLLDPNVLLCCLGSAVNALFTLVCSISLSIFKCDGHPNGERTVISAPEVLCNSREWFQVVGGGAAATFVYCGLSMACFIYGLRASRTRMRDASFRQRWMFLLVKFRPVLDWWFLLVLLKGLLLNLVQVIFDNGHDQLFFFVLILMAYTVATTVYLPWRHMTCNRADIIIHFSMVAFCSTLSWYARVETQEVTWRNFVIAYGLWVPFTVQVLFVFYCVVAYRRRQVSSQRITVHRVEPLSLQLPFMAFALMPEAERLELVESMAPVDRVLMDRANQIIKVQLETTALQKTAADFRMSYLELKKELATPKDAVVEYENTEDRERVKNLLGRQAEMPWRRIEV